MFDFNSGFGNEFGYGGYDIFGWNLKCEGEICYGYRRISSLGQKTGGSLEHQHTKILEYVDRKKMILSEMFSEARSAKEAGRKEYDRLMKAVARHKKPINIVCYFVDRMYRNPQDFAYLDLLMRKNPHFKLHIISENLVLHNNSSPEVKKMYWNSVGDAIAYSQKLSRVVKWGNEGAVKRGYRPGNIPLGYKRDKDLEKKSIIIADDSKKHFIKRAFEYYASGNYSLESLTQHLINSGFMARRKPITRATLWKILNDIFYTGYFVYNGERYKGKHPALIDKALFQQVQKQLRSQCSGMPLKKEFLFARLIKCHYCGCMIVGEMKKGKYIYWHCTNRKNGYDCKKTYIRQEIIKSQIEKIFDKIYIEPSCLKKIEVELLQMHKHKSHFCRLTQGQIENEIKKNKDEKKELLKKLAKGVIDDIDYKEMAKEYDLIIDKLEIEKEKIKYAPKSFEDYTNKLLELGKNAKNLYLRGTDLEKRTLIKMVCSNLTLKDEKLLYELNSPFEELSNLSVVSYGGR